MLFVAALSYATQAIAAFNNGARRWDRLAELVRVQLVDEVVFMAVCSAVVCGIALYVIFTIPLVYVFGALMGIGGVWWAQLVANMCAGVLSLVLARREVNRLHALQEA